MVEAEDDPARRGRHAPPQRRQHQEGHHQPWDSPSASVASQSRLHNFSFPSMSWGNQRLLRCVKVESLGGARIPDPRSAAAADDDLVNRRRPTGLPRPSAARRGRDRVQEEGQDGHLVMFTDSVMDEFQKAVGRIPLPSSLGAAPTEYEGVKDPPVLAPSAAGAEVSRPWNLRLRRAACNAPAAAWENGLQKAQNNPLSHSPTPHERKDSKAANFRGQTPRSEVGSERKQRPKFSSMLSNHEILEDFFVMTGSKPPRRPKKRPRNVQRQIDILYPGFYLCEITPDLYNIAEGK